MSDVLKPCPFCGSSNMRAEAGIYSGMERLSVTIKCHECGASIWGFTMEEAIAAWNRREDV